MRVDCKLIDIRILCENFTFAFYKSSSLSLSPFVPFGQVFPFVIGGYLGNCIASAHYQNEQLDSVGVQPKSNVERNNLTNGHRPGKSTIALWLVPPYRHFVLLRQRSVRERCPFTTIIANREKNKGKHAVQ